MSAMPDSQPSSGGLGDISFAFRFLRERGAAPLWGFSFFRARRDAKIRRGVFQKSLVLLTPLPLFDFFRSLVALLADAYFGESGADVLRSAIKQMRTWPAPMQLGATPLRLLGRTLTAQCVACEPGPTYAIRPPETAAEAVAIDGEAGGEAGNEAHGGGAAVGNDASGTGAGP